MNSDSVDIVTLFADIAGSTALYQRHGDQAALAAVEGCLSMLKAVTDEFGGRFIKTVGDELMVTFDDVDDAFAAACDMQWKARDLPPLGTDRLALRVGFHLGPALLQNGDVFGDSVNCAARLMQIARGHQVVTSGRTVGSLREQFAAQARKVNRVRLRGSDTEEDIYVVQWDDSDNVTMLLSGTMTRPATRSQVMLQYRGTNLVLGPGRPAATLGRDITNDIMIASRRASRVHARIEWRGDKFVLVDQSTNGTHVVGEDGTETLLRMEEMILRGSGRIGFGAPAATEGEDVLRWSCEAAEPLEAAAPAS